MSVTLLVFSLPVPDVVFRGGGEEQGSRRDVKRGFDDEASLEERGSAERGHGIMSCCFTVDLAADV